MLTPPVRDPISAQPAASRQLRWMPVLVLVIAIAAMTCSVLRPSARAVTDPSSTAASGWYVSVDIHADADTKRRAGFLSRKFRVPLIAEPNASGVEIRRFQ